MDGTDIFDWFGICHLALLQNDDSLGTTVFVINCSLNLVSCASIHETMAGYLVSKQIQSHCS